MPVAFPAPSDCDALEFGKRYLRNRGPVVESRLEDLPRGRKLLANDLEPRGPNTSRAHAGLLLHPLDELDEFGNRVHAQQGQEPAVELERLLLLSCFCKVEELDRLRGISVDQAGDPALCAGR